MYFWPSWVLVTVHRLSLVMLSRATLVVMRRLLTQGLLLLWSRAPGRAGLQGVQT